jgi:hypothetical protein
MASKDYCFKTQQAAIDSCSKNNTNSASETVPTIDPTTKQAKIDTCKQNAKDKYDKALINCSYQARGYGGASSTWHIQCGETATSTYDYERQQCEFIN